MNFQGIRGVFKQNYNLKHLTWLKVGGDADIFFKPEDIEDLKTFLKENNNRFPVTIIGAGSNLIIRDKGVEGIVIKLGRNFTDIQFIDNNLTDKPSQEQLFEKLQNYKKLFEQYFLFHRF